MIEAKGGSDMNLVRRTKQQGAVSLFVVVFSAMLFVAVTVGFTILMLSDQQESTDNDLAQSALDSAYAGTEDAKRVLAQYADCQERNLATVACTDIRTAIERNECNTINGALGAASDRSEQKVQQTETDDPAAALQQAYTCVKISPDTETFVGKTRNEGDIRLVPLKTDGAEFDIVRIDWLQREDMDLGSNDPEFGSLNDDEVPPAQRADYLRLPTKAEWRNENRGAVLRAGVMQYQPGAVNLNNMDDTARASFFYSSTTGLGGTKNTAFNLDNADLHRPLSSANQDNLEGKIANYPVEATCDESLTQGYMCTTYVQLPSGRDANTFHYLTLASMYRDTSFRVSLIDSTSSAECDDNSIVEIGCVKFKNVQPEIDVTGRANDVLRRVVSRVESADANEAPYPRVAVGSKSDICKNFVVTDDPDDYRDDAPTSSCPDLTRP